MNKPPAMMWYTGDWMKDPQVSMCSSATRGIWFDMLNAMHELGRSGQVTGTVEQFCRLCRCTAAEVSFALKELNATGAAEVSERNGNVTVINRRMYREAQERLKAAKRQQKVRRNADVTEEKRECHADVTPYSSYSSSEESTAEAVESSPPKHAGQSPPKAKPDRPTSDPRSQHAAIQTCRGIANAYPKRELWDRLIEVLGDHPDQAKLLACRTEWVERGYNAASWKWATEWYISGIPTKNGNHSLTRSPMSTPKTAGNIAAVEAFLADGAKGGHQ